MNIEYNLQLKDARWKTKRLEILKRDKYKCRKCSCRNNLQIHHKIYIAGRAAWEYTNQFLITLCSKCHNEEHEKKELKEFITTNKKIIKGSNPTSKKKQKIKKIKTHKPNRYNTSWFDWI